MDELEKVINSIETKYNEANKIVKIILWALLAFLLVLNSIKKKLKDSKDYKEPSDIVSTAPEEPVSPSKSSNVIAPRIEKIDSSASFDYLRSGLFGKDYKKIEVGDGYGADRRKWRSPEQIARGNWYHKGQDFSAPLGTPIYSPHSGKVIKVNNSVQSSGGRSVTLLLDGGITLYLAHLSSIKVSQGQSVKRGTLVALSGGSGLGKEKGYDYHLHIQMKRSNDKDWVDPKSVNFGYGVDDLAMIGIGFFINNGFTLDQACGFIGNFYAESRFKTDAYNPAGGGRGAQGIAQWRAQRIQHFESFKGKSLLHANFTEQLEFVIRELTYPSIGGDGKYSDKSLMIFYKDYKNMSGVVNCATAVYYKYERPGPGDKSKDIRVNAAKKYREMYLQRYGTTTISERDEKVSAHHTNDKGLNK